MQNRNAKENIDFERNLIADTIKGLNELETMYVFSEDQLNAVLERVQDVKYKEIDKNTFLIRRKYYNED